MKIGILTFHQAINHGAALQVYALQTTLKKINPSATVKVINYDQPYITEGTKLINIRKENLVRSIIGTCIRFPASFFRNRNFQKFSDNYLEVSELLHSGEDLRGFETYIVGSDQVWNYEITRGDKAFLLDSKYIDKDSKKISYAASIGKTELSEDEKVEFKKQLTSFDAISVRELSAKELLSSIVNNKIIHVLDPTLLLTKDDWKCLANESHVTIPEKYILVYSLEKNDMYNQVISYYKKKFSLEVVEISSSINLNSLKNTYGPNDYLRLFDNAEFVITNSFHGTAFSIIFNKNFVTIPHSTRGTRMRSLLDQLKLSSRLIDDTIQLDKISTEIDFSEANILLNQLKNESISFLVEAIKLDQEKEGDI